MEFKLGFHRFFLEVTMRFVLGFFTVVAVAGLARSQPVQVFPPNTTLSGVHASQQLLALRTIEGATSDVTGKVEWTSSDDKVVRVDASGLAHAVGDGEAIVTARIRDTSATTRVQVKKTKEPFTWDFDLHVIPVLTKLGCNSGACHGALAGKGGLKLSLRGYDSATDHFVLTRQAGGRRVDLQEPHKSLLLQKPAMAIPHGGGMKLDPSSQEYTVLVDWIASGAPASPSKSPRMERIEVFPSAVTTKPKQKLNVVVRAWYSDGKSEDVTRWAKFASTEELIASVDDGGQIKTNGHGEAAITVWFSNQVAVSRITIPLDNNVPDEVFAKSPNRNLIDENVITKLKALRIPPSPQATDREFLRRIYLDMLGVIPTPDEQRTFLADGDPTKREKLIDRLLERTEFVDFWSYKWSDLLLISSRKLSQPNVRAFYQFVRRSVADNKPWNQFAREILTAKGGSFKRGEANYFLLHKDVSDLTEATAVTFLGMSITCARCHNHPLEKWTQDQYWGLANLFAQVTIKNGERGEFIVQSAVEGDVLHPRRGIPVPAAPLDGPTFERGDRRDHFARWLTAPENPYFAKALVNRVWRNFFGRGLVEAEDDFRQTNPASNEELLNALARDFVKHQFDVKRLIRLIANSAAYQRSSQPLPANQADDRFYSRYLLRRLPAEVVLDAYSSITKVPTAFTSVALGSSGGQSATGDFPLGTRALQLPDTQLVSLFLDAFGRPERGQTCSCERQSDSSVTQALHLNNGQTLNDKLRDKKSRVEEWTQRNVSNSDALRQVFELALCREPTKDEEARFLRLMAEGERDGQTRREVFEDLFWAVLTGREFLFNR